jgi:hypothetical protein
LNGLLVTATEEHECSSLVCPKKNRILIGEKAIKAPPNKSSIKPRYYHAETCWPPIPKAATK